MNHAGRLAWWNCSAADKIYETGKGLGGVDMLQHQTFRTRRSDYCLLRCLGRLGITRAEIIHVIMDGEVAEFRRGKTGVGGQIAIDACDTRGEIRLAILDADEVNFERIVLQSVTKDEAGFGGAHRARQHDMPYRRVELA